MFRRSYDSPLPGRASRHAEPAAPPCPTPPPARKARTCDPAAMARTGGGTSGVRGYRNPERIAGHGRTACAPAAVVVGEGAFADDVARGRRILRAARRFVGHAAYLSARRVKVRGHGPIDGDLGE